LTKAHGSIKKDYGNIVRFSGLEPRRDMVMVYTAEDIETVFRHEGIWPERPSLRCMNHYRTIHRKDFFKGVGGILNEYLINYFEPKCHFHSPFYCVVRVSRGTRVEHLSTP
jgi:hypothetical protein